MGHARGRLFVPRPRGTTYAEVTAWLSETGSAAPAQRVRDPGRGGRRHGFRKSSPMGGGRQWLPADSCCSINIVPPC